MTIGYGASRLRLVSDADVDALSRFVMLFAVSSLLFISAAQLDLAAAMSAELLLTFYASGLITFCVGVFVSRRVFRRRPGEAVAAGFCSLFGNTVFMGMPVIQRAYGEETQAAMLAVISLNAAIIYFIGVTAMETLSRSGAGFSVAAKKVARSLSRNPMAVSVAAGFAVNLTHAPMPLVAVDAFELLGGAALPGGLFAAGASLTRYDLRGAVNETAAAVALKLILYPALTLIAAVFVFELSAPEAQATIILASLPGGLNIYLFATIYRRGEALAASALLSGTVLAVVTIPLWLALAQALYPTP